MSTPKVSILTTVYNREKYIAECIKSVLASTYQDWELIIVDDQSTDHSVAIAKEYEKRDKRIKVFVNKQNLGQFENRNYAASLAKGDYLKYLDSDDQIYQHGLNVMVEAAEQYPDAGLIISHDQLHEDKPYPILLESREAFYAFYYNKGFPSSGPSASLIKKTIFEQINGFPKPYYVGTDVLLWLKIAQVSNIIKIQPALNWYRQHEGQAISQGVLSNEYLKLDYNYLVKYLNDSLTLIDNIEKKQIFKMLKRRQLRKLVRFVLKTGKILEAASIFRHNKLTLYDLKFIF
tara:strand:+ start:20345 stop:21214 length:870 start_codon:yes stop_codon:yes gene_type:complete